MGKSGSGPRRPPGKTGGAGSRPAKPPGKKRKCPMEAAVVSVKRGRFRLARRYAAMSVRLIVARVAW